MTFRLGWLSLGGEDFDQRVMDHFIKLYKKKKGKDIRGNNRAVQKLRREVEKAKRALSSQHQARIEIESFFESEDFSETLTRAKFEELNMVKLIFRSTSKSRPNNIRGGKMSVRPYVRPSVRPSVRPQKVSSIWMKVGI